MVFLLLGSLFAYMFDQLSLKWVRYILLTIRGNLFERETPKDMDLLIKNCSTDKLEEILGNDGFTNIEELSFYYKGEDLNIAKPVYVDNNYKWYQIHVRSWERNGNQYLSIHKELDPTMHPSKHLQGEEYTKSPSVEYIQYLIQNEGCDVVQL